MGRSCASSDATITVLVKVATVGCRSVDRIER